MLRKPKMTAGAVNGLELNPDGSTKRPIWPWFGGVSTVVENVQDVPGTLVRNGLDFSYDTRPLFRKLDGPNSLHHTDLFEVSKLRAEVVAVSPFGETKPLHAHVSTRHTFEGHQPEDMVRIFAMVASEHPLAFESLVVLDHGRTIFAAAKAYQSRSTLFGTEIIEPYICFSTGVDRATNVWCELVLPNCMNAFPNFINGRSALRFTHHKALRMLDLMERFSLEGTTQYQADISAMAQKYLDSAERRRYFSRILWDNRATLYQVKMAGENAPRSAVEMSIEKFRKHNEHIDALQHWNDNAPGQQQDCRRGNVWGAFNAVLFWTAHAKRSNVHEQHSRKNSILQGPLNAIKKSALRSAQALAA